MAKIDKARILAGRKAVNAYRTAHTALHRRPWHRGIPEEHTPLLNAMLKVFRAQGFDTIQEFFDASEELNIQELDFVDREDFRARATQADRQLLEAKWK